MQGSTSESISLSRWGSVLVLICATPAILGALGVDFSTASAPITAVSGAIDGVESAHEVLRGSYTHTLLEWTAVCFAAFAGALAFIQFRLTRDPSLPIIGMALICAGSMDAFHTLAADRLIEAVAANKDLIPFTWAICRLFNAMILLIGVGLFALPRRSPTRTASEGAIAIVCIAFVVAAYFVIHASASSESLPQTMYPDSIVRRPFDVIPILPYVLCLFVVFPRYAKKRPSALSSALILSAIPQLATQLYMAFGSSELHDSAFNIAHALKAVSYAVPMSALMSGLVTASFHQERISEELGQRRRNAELISQVTVLMGESKDFVSALKGCLKLVCTSVGWDVGHVYLPAANGSDELESASIWFVQDRESYAKFRRMSEGIRFRRGEGLPGRI